MKNVEFKLTGISKYSAEEYNPNQEELENSVRDSSQVLDGGNTSQLGLAVGRYASSGGFFYEDVGAVNAFILQGLSLFKKPVFYFNGMRVTFRALNDNSASSTINVTLLGSVPLKDPFGQPLGPKKIIAGDYITAVYVALFNEFRIIASRLNLLPIGAITIWKGSIVTIPDGWILCDGTGGTPNLTDRFVKGGVDATGAAGGSLTSGLHSVTIQEMPIHTHTYSLMITIDNHNTTQAAGSHAQQNNPNTNSGSSGSSQAHAHDGILPPYSAVAFIQRIY